MIDLEKMNKILNSLENLSNDLARVNLLTKDFQNALDSTREYMNNVKNYDVKTEELSRNIETLSNELDNIRKEYHKVSSSFEVVETDLKQFSSKLDLIAIDIKKEFTSINERLIKENKSLKILLVVTIILSIGFGLLNLFI